MSDRREVYVAGIGLHPFGKFPELTTKQMSEVAVLDALRDGGVPFRDVQAAYYGQVYRDGTSGQLVLQEFGLTGIPVINVRNACASGSTAFWQAFQLIEAGVYDVVLAFGSESVPRGPVSAFEGPERYLGSDHMMAEYSLRMQSYMHRYDAPLEAIAQVSVKAHRNATLNPNAQYQKVFTLEEVVASRMIASPLTLFQCCPTSDGASAAVLVGGDVLHRYEGMKRAVRVRGAAHRTTPHRKVDSDEPEGTALAAADVYEMSGVGPGDVDVVQVHDAATIGEIEHLEYLGLFEPGTGWVATREGRTEISGDLPVNTDGGLQAMGHPFGASGIRMVHELVTQLRSEARDRQIATRPRIGLAQCTGSGGVSTVIMVGAD
jgi:acetyl-CoA acetyltransferase